MKFLNKLAELSHALDDEGLYQFADRVDDMIERYAAMGTEVRVRVQDDEGSNQYLASLDVFRDGNLAVGGLEQVSSPIFQTEEDRASGNLAPGVAAMKLALHKHLAGLRMRHPELKAARVIILDQRFV